MNIQSQFIETIKVYEGKFFNLPFHIRRMQSTASTFFGRMDNIIISEDDIPSQFRKGLVKCRIVYANTLLSIEYEHYSFRNIKSLTLIEDNEIEYSYKSTDRRQFNNLMQRKGNADDIIIVKNGLITDTSYTNLVFEDLSGLYTPDSYLLNGTKRQSLIRDGVVKERRIGVADITSYSKVYLINAMMDIDDAICVSLDMII